MKSSDSVVALGAVTGVAALASIEVGYVGGIIGFVGLMALLALGLSMVRDIGGRIMGILNSPYYYSGAIISRLSVLVATTITMAIVYFNDDALKVTAWGYLLTRYVHENVIAGAFLVMCITMIARLVLKSKPHWIGGVAYAVLFCFWVFIAGILWFYTRPLQPTITGWATVGAVLSIYSLVSRQKHDSPADPGPVIRWAQHLCKHCGLSRGCDASR